MIPSQKLLSELGSLCIDCAITFLLASKDMVQLGYNNNACVCVCVWVCVPACVCFSSNYFRYGRSGVGSCCLPGLCLTEGVDGTICD